MARNELIHFFASVISLLGQFQKLAHVVDGESEFSRSADETKSLKVLGRIAAIVPGRATGRGQKADLS
jgi:hypothetical protein